VRDGANGKILKTISTLLLSTCHPLSSKEIFHNQVKTYQTSNGRKKCGNWAKGKSQIKAPLFQDKRCAKTQRLLFHLLRTKQFFLSSSFRVRTQIAQGLRARQDKMFLGYLSPRNIAQRLDLHQHLLSV
jgi:hypothetical protein